ncbi:MAG: hydrogenase maturation protease, partial [Planctomycetes bacterium]|nr:hydrogenase maturation protease [Planctomycetota bacterium]
MLILGVGNALRGDDAAGLQAARLLRDRVPEGVVVAEFGGDASGLLDDWAGHESVILIDAVSSGAAPGTVLRLDAAAAPVPAGRSGVSSHAFGVAEAIE